MGYRRMVLDTMPEMAGAPGLYRQYGFVETTPYWAHPAERAAFMERLLTDRGNRIKIRNLNDI